METKEITQYCLGFGYYNDCVVLIKKERPKWQKGFLNGVGGKLEKNETALEAMIREFFEETGQMTTADQWIHAGELIDPSLTDASVHIFICKLTGYQFRSIYLNGSPEGSGEDLVILNVYLQAFLYHQSKKMLHNVLDLLIETYRIYVQSIEATIMNNHEFVSRIKKP